MGQEVSKRMVQSARHNSCPKDGRNNSTKGDQNVKAGSDVYRRSKSVSMEVLDAKDIGVHHILELPSLLEPKGLISISTDYYL